MTNPFQNDIFADYTWNEGKPIGKEALTSAEAIAKPIAYKIVKDPYQKHISIEMYELGRFTGVVYDTHLFDFRHLKPVHQRGWQKEILSETPNQMICLIRDLDDRIILRETYSFDNGLCRQCIAESAHGLRLSVQEIYYTSLGDDWNGVILFDTTGRIVMKKNYLVGPDGFFTELCEENEKAILGIPTIAYSERDSKIGFGPAKALAVERS